MPAEVIVHHLDQAKAVLRVAEESGRTIQLRTAPGAAASAGVGYLHALGEAAGHELLVDCGDDAGLVMAALRSGCRKLIFAGSSEQRRRLSEIARRQRAEIRGAMDRSPPCLALSPDEEGESVRSWLVSNA